MDIRDNDVLMVLFSVTHTEWNQYVSCLCINIWLTYDCKKECSLWLKFTSRSRLITFTPLHSPGESFGFVFWNVHAYYRSYPRPSWWLKCHLEQWIKFCKEHSEYLIPLLPLVMLIPPVWILYPVQTCELWCRSNVSWWSIWMSRYASADPPLQPCLLHESVEHGSDIAQLTLCNILFQLSHMTGSYNGWSSIPVEMDHTYVCCMIGGVSKV